ncbi:MAG: hypothetical protein WBB45_16440 [Cyclobacteriaceae bacterium]
MKFPKAIYAVLSLVLFIWISGCSVIDLFPEEKIVIEGHVYEAFDKTRPVQGVLVEGCTQKLSLISNHRDCKVETVTDSEGYFYLSFTVDGLEGSSYRFSKELYDSIEPCDVLPDGTLECYVRERETYFTISGGADVVDPIPYDSLTMQVSTTAGDTTLTYITSEHVYTEGMTYHWAPRSNPQGRASTRMKVADNSNVSYSAVYYRDSAAVLTESDQVFCAKGRGHIYDMRIR